MNQTVNENKTRHENKRMASIHVVIILYVFISIPLFLLVFKSSNLVVDEEFHLRQGRHYCEGKFHVWDDKITTFPGLYILSSIFLLPLNICSTFALRLTSLISSIINVLLIFEIRRGFQQKVNSIKIAFEAFMLGILPPMYLFAHLYYTDIASITMVLGMLLFNKRERHNIAAVFGLLSVLMRQTNIIWVGMVLGCTVMDKLISQTLPFIKGSEKRSTVSYNFRDIVSVLGFYCKRFYLVPKQIRLLFVYLLGYISVILAFITFVITNGSIVVGDKAAHQASVHIPQIFYFSLFYVFFSPSVVITYVQPALETLRKHWAFCTFLVLSFGAVISMNTIIHPYMLADNRHYLFYVWNKFYGRFIMARFIMAPFYLLSLTILHQSISARSAGFKLIYALCSIISIALQQLIEVRYFIIPFLIARLSTNSVKFKLIILDLVFYLTINAIVFYLFSTKEIYWKDYDHVQRLIW